MAVFVSGFFRLEAVWTFGGCFGTIFVVFVVGCLCGLDSYAMLMWVIIVGFFYGQVFLHGCGCWVIAIADRVGYVSQFFAARG